MKRVAILGGGPSGAFAAERLASAGIETFLFDEKLAWEKPCGGGLTYKAYSQYPFLIDNDTPKRLVTETVLTGSSGTSASLRMHEPLVVYSRLDLNRMMLARAERAGAHLEKARVLDLKRNGRWLLRTSAGSLDADFCIVATGARNPLREVGTRLTAADTMTALGYYVPGDQQQIDIQFLAGMEGYIWVFPRCGHLSVGICGKGVPASELRTNLERYLSERGIEWQGATFYSHLLPSLGAESWKGNRVAGDGWLAVGDAAGLVDPVTGEGLYYAIRSADLAATALLSSGEALGERSQHYRRLLGEDFIPDLELASRLASRFFRGRFLFGSVTGRLVEITARSPHCATILQDLFAGTQRYQGLKRLLLRNIAGTLYDLLLSLKR
ncbi:MAG TPA: NAD(P)/FAD-dependent oxidoreductase [Bryobacteraceae bacterium]|nr:NAD(P)/FAD-dependent oxidoreductase [Bryobacteraceae bacterium]